MASTKSAPSTVRIFLFATVLTLVAFVGTLLGMGAGALFVVVVLTLIELTFSFDNAIVNAKILTRMNRFWQQMFLTVGIVIAVFGVRFVLPIVIVMASAGLGWSAVIHLALHDHAAYAQALLAAHEPIAAFGGMFLLVLSLTFLFDKKRLVDWISPIEKQFRRIGHWWVGPLISIIVLIGTVAALPGHRVVVALAGGIGLAIFGIVHGLSRIFEKGYERGLSNASRRQIGLMGLTSFLYLQVLDAGFSLDGVVGAFAITKDVVLIAIGLGVGAIWVRSLTIYMVHRNVLGNYRYLEHGAFYTIGALAIIMLVSLYVDVPQLLTAGIGVLIIITAVLSSVRYNKRRAVS